MGISLMRLSKAILIIAIGILIGIMNCSKAMENNGLRSRKKMLVHYMPWYESKPISGKWGWHWTMNYYNPDEILPNGQNKIASIITR